jgi:hypothetical protein
MSQEVPKGWELIAAAVDAGGQVQGGGEAVRIALGVSQSPVVRRGRPSLSNPDEKILERIAFFVREGCCLSVWEAAGLLAKGASGGGTIEARQKRLVARYEEWVQNWIDEQISAGVFRPNADSALLKAKNKGRQRGAGSYKTFDEPLWCEMDELLHPPKYDFPWNLEQCELEPQCSSPWEAAGVVAPRALGYPSKKALETRQYEGDAVRKRLLKGFLDWRNSRGY